jgi:hypothetical protein
MLHSSLLLRKSLAVAGVLLLLLSSSADALGLHRCAHHDALPPAAEPDAQPHHQHHSAPAEDDESAGCTCVGTCSLSGVALAPRAVMADLAALPAISVLRIHAAIHVRAMWQAHRLPYSTAPPAAL